MDKFASVKNRNYTANPTQPLLHGPLDLSVDRLWTHNFFFLGFESAATPCNLAAWCRCYGTIVQYTYADMPSLAHGVVLIPICTMWESNTCYVSVFLAYLAGSRR